MLSLNNKQIHNTSSIRVIPVWLIYIYILLILGDLLTTYVATPTLQYEGNIIIRTFNLGWVAIILLSLFFACAMSFFVIKFNKNIISFISQNNRKADINIVIGIVIHVMFITHFLASLYAIPNNYLGYLYLTGTHNVWLKDIVFQFIRWNKLLNVTCYYLLLNVLFLVLSILLITYRLYYLKKEYV